MNRFETVYNAIFLFLSLYPYSTRGGPTVKKYRITQNQFDLVLRVYVKNCGFLMIQWETMPVLSEPVGKTGQIL